MEAFTPAQLLISGERQALFFPSHQMQVPWGTLDNKRSCGHGQGAALSPPGKCCPWAGGKQRPSAENPQTYGTMGKHTETEQLALAAVRPAYFHFRLRVKLDYHAGCICSPALHSLPAAPDSCILMVIPQSVPWQLRASWSAWHWQGHPLMTHWRLGTWVP